jgi:hypothetical protein
MTTTQTPQVNKINSMTTEDRWCFDTQERSLSFVSPINFDAAFQDDGMRRGYELLGRVNMEAYIG